MFGLKGLSIANLKTNIDGSNGVTFYTINSGLNGIYFNISTSCWLGSPIYSGFLGCNRSFTIRIVVAINSLTVKQIVSSSVYKFQPRLKDEYSSVGYIRDGLIRVLDLLTCHHCL